MGLPLTLNGLTARLAPDGSVEYVDATGTVAATTPRGQMSDPDFDPHSREPAVSQAVTYRLTTTADGKPALEVTADAAWIHDPSRVFPVTVDPSLNFGTSGSTYTEQKYNGNNNSAEPDAMKRRGLASTWQSPW